MPCSTWKSLAPMTWRKFVASEKLAEQARHNKKRQLGRYGDAGGGLPHSLRRIA